MQHPPRIRFRPVELKTRHDDFSPARQQRFIDELAATTSISRACKAVGMSRMSAYKLRDHPDAGSFRLAWNAALGPDFADPRPRAPARAKLTAQRQPTSSALSTLQTYLAELREQEEASAANPSWRGA